MPVSALVATDEKKRRTGLKIFPTAADPKKVCPLEFAE
jgi:hypothetical protein